MGSPVILVVSNEDQNDSPEATEEQVLDMIESAIQSVLNDETMSIEVTFCYKANLTNFQPNRHYSIWLK